MKAAQAMKVLAVLALCAQCLPASKPALAGDREYPSWKIWRDRTKELIGSLIDEAAEDAAGEIEEKIRQYQGHSGWKGRLADEAAEKLGLDREVSSDDALAEVTLERLPKLLNSLAEETWSLEGAVGFCFRGLQGRAVIDQSMCLLSVYFLSTLPEEDLRSLASEWHTQAPWTLTIQENSQVWLLTLEQGFVIHPGLRQGDVKAFLRRYGRLVLDFQSLLKGR